MALPLVDVLTGKCSLAVLLLIVLSASPPSCQGAARNITAILAAQPDLDEFSKLLTSTGLANDINQQNTPITVLAVDNAGMAPLKAKGITPEKVRRSLSVHVLLECYDDAKLGRIVVDEPVFTHTMLLLKPLGHAASGTGLLMVGREPTGDRIDFVPMGNRYSWTFAVSVKSVYQVPGDISVLQVSKLMALLNVDFTPPYKTRKTST